MLVFKLYFDKFIEMPHTTLFNYCKVTFDNKTTLLFTYKTYIVIATFPM